MFRGVFEGWHIAVIAIVILLIWGGPKLPGIAKNLGESMRVFRKEMRTMNDEKAADKKAKSGEATQAKPLDSSSESNKDSSSSDKN